MKGSDFDKAMKVLGWLGSRRAEFTVPTFAAGVGVHIRVAYRWMTTLEARRYVEQTREQNGTEPGLYRSTVRIGDR